MNHNRCCSIIVTHNRKDLLKRCIEHNLAQTVEQDILVVDNASTDGTKSYLTEHGLLDNSRVIYKYNEMNDFGAGGFNLGLDYVFSQGYNFAWLMDDDGFPKTETTLEKLFDASATINTNEWILNSVVLGNNYSLAFGFAGMRSILQIEKWENTSGRTVYENEANPFNGTLITREAFNKIGNIRKDFVIHGDEVEYIERAKFHGVFVGTVVDSFFYHPKKLSKEYFNGNQHGWFVYTQPWMEYYETRNHICLLRWYKNETDVNDYIANVKMKVACAPYDTAEYEKYIISGIRAGLEEDFTALKEHTQTKLVDDANKHESDRFAEKYSRLSVLLASWLERKKLGLSIADDLRDRCINSVAIYGMNELGRQAAFELRDSRFDVAYVMDRNPNAESCGYKLLSLDDELEEVDAVIITVFKWASSIRRELTGRLPDTEIIDIDELL
ncbi:MAG: glycosyltransferase [Lachnospiraceae bacterium]|nr:glycosyltransferase [Lachnospiraceae bacterium]